MRCLGEEVFGRSCAQILPPSPSLANAHPRRCIALPWLPRRSPRSRPRRPKPRPQLPMYGKVPSLNVHVAGALVAYQALLGRR